MPRHALLRRPALTALAATATLTLAACGASDAGAGTTTSAADAESCPGEVLDVVASVSQWGSIVEQLGGDCTNVTTVLASSAVDPHDYEATAADIAAFTDAELVVLNGADYDHWAADAVATLDPAPAVVDAAEVVGIEGEEHAEEEGEHAEEEGEHAEEGHGHGGVNPHLWYSPEYVQTVAGAVTEQLSELSPDAADHFAEQAEAWEADLQPYLDELESLQSSAAGRSYAATESVFQYTAEAIGLTDATPEGYRDAASNETDPAPGDVAAFEAALTDGSVDVLVYNSQTEGSVPEQLRAAAETAGVPVVEVTESAPDGEPSFVSWQLDQLQQLSNALGGGQ
ncbi:MULTISPECIES: metal ABC transporter solute-binding protein, Zn/Mn family [unclassified Modestobacter]|uniref:metal ABC transporter solute-binding protein, Zn/Mn family n=1 Tax=unclassified Modestobacter TaxID=2643866 RepID=UPI0022AA9542|nr:MULTISPECIES: zinc ABC transporter substrate-binding protein [unclassified Modestobacter]MCZ2823357.1 zinc ABC transporter substrate-binding protein [Modestobacter sp. VKM Ac-2981]MCZ2851602.1 zinc ABC transporter substrate-binding protein [Modestobacter sp. VKM Ac-2982]